MAQAYYGTCDGWIGPCYAPWIFLRNRIIKIKKIEKDKKTLKKATPS
jgi:hypothetical protein